MAPMFSLKNPGRGIYVSVFALKNPDEGCVVRVRSKKKPLVGHVLTVLALKNPGRVDRVRSQKPWWGFWNLKHVQGICNVQGKTATKCPGLTHKKIM